MSHDYEMIQYWLESYNQGGEDRQHYPEGEVAQEIRRRGLLFDVIEDGWWSKPDFVLSTIPVDFNLIELSSDSLLRDIKFMKRAVKIDPRCMFFFEGSEKKTLELVKYAVNLDGINIALIENFNQDFNLQSDDARNLLRNHIGTDWGSSELYQDFLELVLDGDRDKARAEILRSAVGENGLILCFVEDNIWYDAYKHREDVGLVKLAIKQNGMALLYASYELQNNQEIVELAIEQDGMALQYAAQRFTDNKKVVLKAIHSCNDVCSPLKFVSPRLQEDEDVVLAALRKSPFCLRFASPLIQTNKKIVLEAIKAQDEEGGKALRFASDKLKNDKEVVLAAVASDGESWEFASKQLQNDKDVILAALLERPDAFSLIHDNCPPIFEKGTEFRKICERRVFGKE